MADQRILTTHAGSLPRPAALTDLAPSLVWAKLRSLREGADLVAARLF
ncbi:MAG: hypothetical protein ACSLFP_08555 [Acidimicrobiales bacterium]